MTQNNTFKPLGKLMNLIEEAGYTMEYEYDDLIFVNNTAFIFRFDTENMDIIHLHFNVDCIDPNKMEISHKLLTIAKAEGISLVHSNNFEMSPKEESDEVELIFK